MKIQDLITNAPASKEEDRFVEVRVRLYTHGNIAAVWKTVRSFMRNCTLHAGSKIEFFAGGEELEDEDDHAILEQVEQELPPQPAKPRSSENLVTAKGPPFPPTWDGDLWPGHAPWCGVRVKVGCSCGYDRWLREHQVDSMSYVPTPMLGIRHVPADPNGE